MPMVMMGALRQPSITSASGNAAGRVVPFNHTNEFVFPSGPLSTGVFESKS